MQYSIETVKEYYKKAPENIQDIIASDDTYYFLEGIMEKYNLTREQRNTLGQLFTATIIGVISTNEYTKNLSQEALIVESTAQNIVKEIQDRIFSKITIPKTSPQAPKTLVPPAVSGAVQQQNQIRSQFPSVSQPKTPSISSSGGNLVPIMRIASSNPPSPKMQGSILQEQQTMPEKTIPSINSNQQKKVGLEQQQRITPPQQPKPMQQNQPQSKPAVDPYREQF